MEVQLDPEVQKLSSGIFLSFFTSLFSSFLYFGLIFRLTLSKRKKTFFLAAQTHDDEVREAFPIACHLPQKDSYDLSGIMPHSTARKNHSI